MGRGTASRQREALSRRGSANPAGRVPETATTHEEARDAASQLLGVQRRAGNQATLALLRAGQAKLSVGAAGDRFEQEADAMARAVVARLGDTSLETPDETRPGAAGAQRVADVVLRRDAEVGAGGGELSADTEQAIRSARRSGRPLDSATRSAMEGAFGADFSAVRLHTGPDATELNERVQAKAFTVGSDIFFRGDPPSTTSKEGQALLAHELTHTVQQGATRPSGASGTTALGRQLAVQRMSFLNTRWDQAVTAKVSSGGGLGVLFLNDNGGPPAVVKAGETFTAEATVAAKLLNQVGGGGSGAPDARPVAEEEAEEIYSKAKALLEQANGGALDKKTNRRELNILEQLEARKGIMVYGYAKGSDLGEGFSTKEDDPNKQTKKGAFGKRKLREGSTSHAFFKSPDMMTTLGRAAAADVVLGNFDRLVGKLNLENIMINMETGNLIWIDNVEAGYPALLATQTIADDTTAEVGFARWAARQEVKQLAQGDYSKMAENLFDNLQQEFTLDKSGRLLGSMRPEDKKLVAKTFRQSRRTLETWFMNGMEAGKKASIAALRNIGQLVSAVPEEQKQEVATALIARRLVLQGQANPDGAWQLAQRKVQMELGARRGLPLVDSRSGSSSSSSRPMLGSARGTSPRGGSGSENT